MTDPDQKAWLLLLLLTQYLHSWTWGLGSTKSGIYMLRLGEPKLWYLRAFIS